MSWFNRGKPRVQTPQYVTATQPIRVKAGQTLTVTLGPGQKIQNAIMPIVGGGGGSAWAFGGGGAGCSGVVFTSTVMHTVTGMERNAPKFPAAWLVAYAGELNAAQTERDLASLGFVEVK